MARTFTGLKLQGELGRFGRTEISDIEGYRELPDGKVRKKKDIQFLDLIYSNFRLSPVPNGVICYYGMVV
jgi:hypothetical protein